jgi:spermidine/putrescine transport system substrate-binding protein
MIDYLLRPEVARAISEEVGYASPNQAAVALMPPEVRNNRTVYPDPAQLVGAEYQVDIGESIALYNRYWELLKAGR